jgi:uncharacterized membrane protein
MPCPYANILGIPGQGFHAIRFAGLAVNDTLATIALALITSFVWKLSFLETFVSWFIIGELLHYYFGVNTAFLQMIHMSPDCS